VKRKSNITSCSTLFPPITITDVMRQSSPSPASSSESNMALVLKASRSAYLAVRGEGT
jgi:hypothetical protein